MWERETGPKSRETWQVCFYFLSFSPRRLQTVWGQFVVRYRYFALSLSSFPWILTLRFVNLSTCSKPTLSKSFPGMTALNRFDCITLIISLSFLTVSVSHYAWIYNEGHHCNCLFVCLFVFFKFKDVYWSARKIGL